MIHPHRHRWKHSLVQTRTPLPVIRLFSSILTYVFRYDFLLDEPTFHSFASGSSICTNIITIHVDRLPAPGTWGNGFYILRRLKSFGAHCVHHTRCALEPGYWLLEDILASAHRKKGVAMRPWIRFPTFVFGPSPLAGDNRRWQWEIQHLPGGKSPEHKRLLAFDQHEPPATEKEQGIRRSPFLRLSLRHLRFWLSGIKRDPTAWPGLALRPS